jgi:hypothetical protein
MKSKLQALLVLSIAWTSSFAQDSKNPGPYNLQNEQAGDATRSGIIQIPRSGEVNTPSADLNWIPGLTHKVMESEPIEPDHEKLELIRAEILRKKLERTARESSTDQTPGTLAVTPVVGVHYGANKNNGWSPLDNNVAISDNGIIVSVANDTFEVDDSLGTRLYYNTLNTLINDATIPNACDPVVLYDHGADRFIFYCQEVTSSGNGPNHMLFFFSKTNNPATGGWNYYKLSGDPLNKGSLADYPKLAISNNDVFVSSNMFVGGSYSGALLWQIQKSTGYSGGTLNSRVWTNITGSPFTLMPVSEGQGNSYGPGCWMVATSSSGSSSIGLYHITDDLTGSPTMVQANVSTTAYTAAGDSPQKGTSATLKITDCRALSGFFLNGLIHFVFSSNDASGNTAINYNRLNVSAKTNTSKLYSVSGLDCGYPAVASYTALGVTNDNSVMIGYASSNSSMYPAMNVISCDNTMNWSTPIVVRASDGYVGSSGSQRWGDYSGMCRKHNSPQACVWMNGSYGNASNKWDAYVAQIYDAGFATAVPENHAFSKLKTFPNPVEDLFTVDFNTTRDSDLDIAVYDMEGRMVKELYKGFCHEGENEFTFNKSNLARGTYLLSIRTKDEVVLHEKIVIAD